MGEKVRIYLDTCCLVRPFDKQKQGRIRQESEAVLRALSLLQTERWEWIASEVLLFEVLIRPDAVVRRLLLESLRDATSTISLTSAIRKRGKTLRQFGFHWMDALHVACAETAGCDTLLTTDDAMVKLAGRWRESVDVSVMNPVQWLSA